MQRGLAHPPVFAPSVGRYAQGMIVEVPLQLWALPSKPEPADLHIALEAAYAGEQFVEVASAADARTYDVSPDAGLVIEFRQLGLRLDVGETGVVESSFGFHLMKRVE